MWALDIFCCTEGMGWEFEPGAVDLQGGPCLRGVRWPGGIWDWTSLAVVTAVGPFLCRGITLQWQKKQKGRLKKSRGCNVSLQAWVFFLHNGVSEIISISSLNYRLLQLHLYKAHVLTVHPWKHFPAVGFTLHMHIENGIPVVLSAILRAGCSSMELVNSGVVF